MTDPKRLLETLDAGYERELLSSAAAERAPSGARNRVRLAALAAMGTAAPLVAAKASAATGGGAVKGTSTLAVTALKWLAVGAVAGGVSSEVATRVAGGREERMANGVATASTVEVASPAAALPPAEVPGLVPAPPDEAAPRPAKERARGGEASGRVLIGTADLELESQSLDHVRFVAASNSPRGLELLDQHEARFPHGALRREARVLRERLRAKLAR